MPKIIGMPKPRFYLSRIQDGEGYVSMVYRYFGNTLYYNPGAKVEEKYWDRKAQRAKHTAKHPEYHDVNRLIGDIENLTLDIYTETKGKIDVDTFRREILYRTGQAERPGEVVALIPTLPEFAHEYVSKRKESLAGKEGTLKALQTVANHLTEYAKETGQRLTFDEVDHNFSHTFTNWMFSPPREFSANYAAKVVSVIRQFMREAKRRKLHQNETFTDFSIKSEKTTKIALDFEELETLLALDLSNNSRLDKVRDLFLIGCYTGLRYSDFSRIKPGHVITIEGEKMLEITTEKTGQAVVIPFMPELEPLLAKYNYNPPTITNQKMNDYLKELCQLAGLTERLRIVSNKAGKRQETEFEKWELITTHVARRSFATNMYLLGIPAINIMKITGHTTEKQFMAYICIDGRLNAQHMAKQIAMKREKPRLRKVE